MNTGWSSFEDWKRAEPGVVASDPGALQAAAGPVLPGQCAVCGSRAGFRNGLHEDPREGLPCLACGCNARQRAVGALVLSASGGAPGERIYLTEQASRLFVSLRRRRPGLRGSEYVFSRFTRLRLRIWLLRKGVWPALMHEDVTALRFAEASLDVVATLDVLEHVPDHRAALAEFARVLGPGGVLLITVPFYWDRPQNTVIAHRSERGVVDFIGEPEYHGDPVSGGVPCFHHFGWALLDDLRDAGFSEVAAHRLRDPEAGLPDGVWVLRAVR